MSRRIGALLNSTLAKAGYQLRKLNPPDELQLPPDMEVDTWDIIKQVKPYTMTSAERVYALLKSIDYICRNGIEGDIVECGVWRGGSSMAVAQRLCDLGETGRGLWLYDTFMGMPEPTDVDVSRGGASASAKFEQLADDDGYADWCRSGLAEVRTNMALVSYPQENIRFVQGKVEDTIPGQVPERISLLRLDTDWYSSTRHELQHLYPRLAQGGVLIVDDYGHWAGCRKAVDEYLSTLSPFPLLCRVDYTGRMAIKP